MKGLLKSCLAYKALIVLLSGSCSCNRGLHSYWQVTDCCGTAETGVSVLRAWALFNSSVLYAGKVLVTPFIPDRTPVIHLCLITGRRTAAVHYFWHISEKLKLDCLRALQRSFTTWGVNSYLSVLCSLYHSLPIKTIKGFSSLNSGPSLTMKYQMLLESMHSTKKYNSAG